jgi:L-lactate dehydrogenase complex protein LldG
VRSSFTKVLAAVRGALAQRAPDLAIDAPASPKMPAAPVVRHTELVSQFAHELERVNGRFIGVVSPGELGKRISALVQRTKPRSIAIGEPLTLDLAPFLLALERSRIELIRCGKSNDQQRRALRERLARCDLAVVEADYAIASTGTLVVVTTPERPSSLTLLPPTNVLLVNAARVFPHMAAVVNALGPATVMAHRVAFITGPSRTADIEKMIVLGVHGPKELYAGVVWAGEGDNTRLGKPRAR